MAITYDWKLNLVEFAYLPETSEAQIMDIHWGCRATDSDSGESVKAQGTISVVDDNYIFPAAAVKNATKQQVFQWLNNKLGDEKQKIKDSLAGQLAALVVSDSFVPVD